jgi:hypothetical protein
MGKFDGLTVSEAPARMTILNPVTGDPVVRKDTGEEAWIELHPNESEVGARIEREITTKALRRRVQALRGRDLEENTIAKLAGLTINWNLALLDGSHIDLACTPDNAEQVYKDVRWLRNQVAAFVNDLGNFQPTS